MRISVWLSIALAAALPVFADAAGSSGDSVAVPHPATTTASPTAEARGRRGTRRIPQSSVTTDGASTGGDVRMMRFPVSLGTL